MERQHHDALTIRDYRYHGSLFKVPAMLAIQSNLSPCEIKFMWSTLWANLSKSLLGVYRMRLAAEKDLTPKGEMVVRHEMALGRDFVNRKQVTMMRW